MVPFQVGASCALSVVCPQEFTTKHDHQIVAKFVCLIRGWEHFVFPDEDIDCRCIAKHRAEKLSQPHSGLSAACQLTDDVAQEVVTARSYSEMQLNVVSV